MSSLAPTLQAFFTDRLIRQRDASAQTVAAYRDTWRLLLTYTTTTIGKDPTALDIADLTPELIGGFLDHLEHARGNSVRTRNARLAAIHSMFRYASLRHPEHADTIQRVLAIRPKRYDRTIVTFLTVAEVDALLAAPDRSTWTGRRDHTLIALAVQTGLRISELITVTNADIHLGTGPHVRCHGKGRKERVTPLTAPTVATTRAWQHEQHAQPADRLFTTRTGRPLSRDVIEHRLARHVAAAASSCSTLATKTVTAHTLRHTAAMRLLEAGIDTTVIALWLGHENVDTTAIYLHADLGIKERALARTQQPTAATTRRYRPPDKLLAFLEAL